MAKKAHEKMFNITNYQRNANQNTTRCHFTLVRMAIILKNLQTINAKEGMQKRESSFVVGRNINWYSHYAEQYGGPLKN